MTIPLKIALMEDAPRKKIEMFIRGLADGVAGRMGRLRRGACTGENLDNGILRPVSVPAKTD
jgi:hypothetical protein